MMFFSFTMSQPEFDGVVFLLDRGHINAAGDLEDAFIASINGTIRYRGFTSCGRVLTEVVDDTSVTRLVLVRNPDFILDEALPGRLASALSFLEEHNGDWSIAAAGGHGVSGDTYCALYSSETPFLPLHSSIQPIVDPLVDITIFDASYLRGLISRGGVLGDIGLELTVLLQGYLDGRVALYLPDLIAGINGPLLPRDPAKLRIDLKNWFSGELCGQTLPTLLGEVRVEGVASTRQEKPDSMPVALSIEKTVKKFLTPLSLSIVTRTRFARTHLLDRLLTSISRSRSDNMSLEVVISTDVAPKTSATEIGRLREKFVNLNIRLQQNKSEKNSRVNNLINGIQAARENYVVVVDDDDYIDLFGFEEIAKSQFMGAQPLIVMNTELHNEVWIETPSGRHILSNSEPREQYSASGWRRMFGGVNLLPICSLIVPRERLLKRLEKFEFRHDMSEDYTLFLLLFTDPQLPQIVELSSTFGHVSIRDDGDNSITLEDRRPWVRDITLFLNDLIRNPSVAGVGVWQLLNTAGKAAGPTIHAQALVDLQAELGRSEKDIRLLSNQINQLREEIRFKATGI